MACGLRVVVLPTPAMKTPVLPHPVVEPLESRIAPALIISEILFGPSGNDFTDEFIEIRGNPGATIPSGTYFVHIEGDAGGEGDVQIVIDLGGLTFGSTGFAVWVQGNSALTIDPLATVFRGVGNSFDGAPRYSQDSGVNNIEGTTGTFMIVKAPVAPLLTDDIDSNNDGTGDGAVFSSWTVLDSVGIHDASSASDRVYGAVNFGSPGAPASSGGTITALSFVPQYLGRKDGTIGQTAGDWFSGQTVETLPDTYSLVAGSVFPASLGGGALDHIGAPNFPQTVTITGNIARWTDVDGDLVTAKRTIGVWTGTDFTIAAKGLGFVVQTLPIGGAGDVSITARRASGLFGTAGDGLVDVGALIASQPVGNILVDGDLARFTSTAANAFKKTVGNVTVASLGAAGSANLLSGIAPVFSVDAGMGLLTVLGDVNRVRVEIGAEGGGNAAGVVVRGSVIGGASSGEGAILVRGQAGTVSVGGDLVGGTGNFSGNITVDGGAKIIRVGGSVVGGDGGLSGTIHSNGRLQSFFIGGDLIGGRGESGSISVGGDEKAPAASAVIRGSILGGTQVFAGIQESASAEFSVFNVKSVIVGGSVVGGGSVASGAIQAEGGVGSILIRGDIRKTPTAVFDTAQVSVFKSASFTVGGSITGASGVNPVVLISERVGKFTVGGDIRTAGSDTSLLIINAAGDVLVGGSIIDDDAKTDAAIFVNNDIKKFTVKGSIRGDSTTEASIRFGSGNPPVLPNGVALGALVVSGSLKNATLVFGDNEEADGSVGSIFIGGDVIASRLIADRAYSPGIDGKAGTLDDAALPATAPDQISRLASLVIRGRIVGDGAGGSSFGIAFDQIKTATVGGEKLTTTAGADLFFFGGSGDAFIRDNL